MTHLRLVHSSDRHSPTGPIAPPVPKSGLQSDRAPTHEPLFLTMRLGDGSELIMCEAGAGWQVIGQAPRSKATPKLANHTHGARCLADMILLSDIAAAYAGAPRRHGDLAAVSPALA